MANSFLTPSIIAQESLMQLHNNLVLGALVNKDYSSEFSAKVGETITVRKPNSFEVDEFDSSIRIQDIKESGVPVTMDKLLDVSFAVNSKDMTLSISKFSERYLAPAMAQFAQEIDSRLAKLALDIPYVVGTAGTTPSGVADITAIRKVMNDNKVPMAGRKLVFDTAADAKLLELDTFNRVDASGSSEALREATLGRKFGFDCFMDQNIAYQSNAGLVAAAPKVASPTAAGATSITLTDTTLTGTVTRGTIFTLAGDPTSYVVKKDATAAANAVTIEIYPALKKNAAGSTAATLMADHSANIAFHRNAFSLVSRTLERPLGSNNVATVNYDGIGLRVVYGYDIHTKTDIISIDGLFGFTTLTPELAVVLAG